MGKVVKTEFGVTEAKPKKEKGKYYKSTKKLLENYLGETQNAENISKAEENDDNKRARAQENDEN